MVGGRRLFDRPDHARPVPAGAHTVCVYSHRATDVVADVDAITYDHDASS